MLNGDLAAATKGLETEPESPGSLLRYPILPDGGLAVPVAWVAAGLKQPVGLSLDRLGALYVSAKEIMVAGGPARDAIGKVHPDAHLTRFAEQLDDPQGTALGPDGSLYVADGKAGRVLRFRAPPAPLLDAIPEFTNQPSLPIGGTTEPRARVDVFVNDATAAVATLSDSVGAFAVPVALDANAPNTVEVFATTHAGDGLTGPPAQATTTHDSIAPGVAFADPPAGAFVRQTVAVRAEGSDGGGVASFALSAGGQTLGVTLSPTPPAPAVTAAATWDSTTARDGTQSLTATATDRAGNTTTITRGVVIDNTAPDTQVIEGPTGEISTRDATFVFTGSDNLTPIADLRFAWRLDGGAWSAFTSATSATLTGLGEGAHTFEVRARDLAGNEDPTPAARTFAVRLGPTITGVDPASGPIGSLVTITGAAFEPGATAIAFNGVRAVLRTVTATSITTTVPIGATTGPLLVTTSRGTASRTFTVSTTGDFTLAANPASARAIAGDQTAVSIVAAGTGSFTGLIALSVSAPPAGVPPVAGITPAVSPSLVAPGGSAFVTLTVAPTVTPGSYAFTVTGQGEVDGQRVTRSVSFAVDVLAPETPAVTGPVLTAEAVPQPIPGATIALGSAFTLTDAGGNFVLLAPPAGANMLLVDGRTASTATAQYPPVEVNINVNASGPTRVPFIVYPGSTLRIRLACRSMVPAR